MFSGGMEVKKAASDGCSVEKLFLVVDKTTEAATRDVFYNKVFLKVSQMSQEKKCVAVSF